LILFQIL